ncbi:MAG: hypothetical protein EBW40_04855 [Gammaproteobacteria bacterium]|nr:hypothetical protein [Gammaproteobacteria bacterium]
MECLGPALTPTLGANSIPKTGGTAANAGLAKLQGSRASIKSHSDGSRRTQRTKLLTQRWRKGMEELAVECVGGLN